MNGIREELSGIGSTFRIATEHKIRQDELRLAERDAEKLLKLAERDAHKAERSRARQMLQKQETYLDDDSLSMMLDLFNENPLLAETYLEVERASLRRVWITKTLSKHGHTIPDSSVPPPE